MDDDTARDLVSRALVVMAVGYATVGAPPLLSPAHLDELRAGPVPSAASIVERAVRSSDPHVVKLSNVALAEEARTGDPLYRLIAGRVVGIVT